MCNTDTKMNDYYSNFPQPPVEERIQNAINGLPEFVKSSVTAEKLLDITREIASKSPDYSLSGYRIFGAREEINKITDAIHKYVQLTVRSTTA